MENGDGMSIDDQLATLSLHLTLVAAVGGVILEHVDLKTVLKDHTRQAHEDGSQIKGRVCLPTMYSRSMKGSLMATISTFLEVKAARDTRRPMRPNLGGESSLDWPVGGDAAP